MSRSNVLGEGLLPTGLRPVSRKYAGENNPNKTKEELGKSVMSFPLLAVGPLPVVGTEDADEQGVSMALPLELWGALWLTASSLCLPCPCLPVL